MLVNNAGILRDRVLVNLSEEDWDAVINVHLKGHFVPTRHAAAYWREQAKAGKTVHASMINTSSTSGLLGNVGQSNYGAAKAGIAAFTVIIAEELGRYGVRVNAIAPAARTRMTESTPGLSDYVVKPRTRRSLTSGIREHLPARRDPRDGELCGDGSGLLRPGRHGSKVPELDDDRDTRTERSLDGRRARSGAAHTADLNDMRHEERPSRAGSLVAYDR